MTEKAQFDIPLVLPGVADAADACVERIIGRLRPRAGVDQVHVLPATTDQPAKLCIHYDPDALSLSTVRAEVSAAGAEIANQYGHLIWQIAGLHARRARTIGNRLAQPIGFRHFKVGYGAGFVAADLECGDHEVGSGKSFPLVGECLELCLYSQGADQF
mgnify:CR=1 FL=1